MKILILHQYFKTPSQGGALRSYYLGKALVENGVNAVVITAHNEATYKRVNVEGIDVHYLPVSYDNEYGFIRRTFSFLQFVWKSVKLSRTLTGIDLCYTISVPLTVGLAALRIRKREGVPFIFEVGDLWPDAPIQMGFVNNRYLRRFLFWLEKHIYEKANSVVALSPSIQQAILKKIPGKTVHLIPNMSDCDFYQTAEKTPEQEAKWNVSEKFVVSYIGAVGFANGLEYYLQCAKASQQAGLPVHFFLCGEGALLHQMKDDSRKLGLNNLTFVGFRNREGVKELLDISDASFVCYKNVPILETGSPNKYFDGLAAGKLIVINFGGWIRKEVESNQCGVFVDPNHPEDFVQKLNPFLKNADDLRAYQKSARALAKKCYARPILSQKFIEVIQIQ